MKDKTALKLIAEIENAIRELQAEKTPDFQSEISCLEDTIGMLMDMSDSVKRCSCCNEVTERIGRLEDECYGCLDVQSDGVTHDQKRDFYNQR
jgi:hypothetical protein